MGQVADGAHVEGDGDGENADETPTPTTAQQMADDLRQMTEGGDGATPPPDGGDAGDGGDPSTPPPPPDPATQPEVIEIGGFQIPVEQTESVVALLEWASNLTEEQAAAAFAAASGQQPPAPAQQAPATPPPPAEPEAPTSLIPDEIRTAYPEVATVMEKMEEEIRALRGEVEPRIEQVEMVAGHEAMTRQQREAEETETRVRETFLREHSLSDDEYLTVTRTVGQLGIVPTLVDQFGLEEGFKRALDIGYTATPEFRDRDIQNALRQQQTEAKKQKAGSLTPQGGSAPRTPGNPSHLPTTERKSAMVADIQQLLDG